MATLLHSATFISRKLDGTPNALGRVYTYAAGTLTPLASYTTQAGGTSNTNPVILDADGTAQVWLSSSLSYRIIEKTAADATIRDVDNLSFGGVLAADLISTATGNGAGLVGYKMPGTGTIATTQQQVNEETVCVTRFMTAAQITNASGSDCAAAVQAAVNYCLHPDRAGKVPVLEVPLFIRVDSSINIDRPVNTTSNEFRIRATGRLGGFYTTVASLNFFSSTIAHTSFPVSEWIRFEGLHFETNERSNLVNVMRGDKFLRVTFDGCYFLRCRVAHFTNYAQTWRLNGCRFFDWFDWLMSCTGMYDVHVSGCALEEGASGKGFSEFDPTNATGARGCSFVGNLVENIEGPFVSLSNAQGIHIAGNYSESNAERFIDLLQGTTAGVSVVGNYIQTANGGDANFFEIAIGACEGFYGAGNYTDGRLYDFTSATAFATILGDRAQLGLSRGAPSLSVGNNASGLKFPATATGSSDVNTLDDYEEGTWTPTVGAQTNASATAVTTATYTKIGRQISIQLRGTTTITAPTTATGFVLSLPLAQGALDDPAMGAAMLATTGCGFVYDNAGANGTEIFVGFPANQTLASGAGQVWRASLTYNAAT